MADDEPLLVMFRAEHALVLAVRHLECDAYGRNPEHAATHDAIVILWRAHLAVVVAQGELLNG